MRRLLALSLIVASVAGACAQEGGEGAPAGPTMAELGDETQQTFELLLAPGEFVQGPNRLVMRVQDAEGQLIPGLDLDLYYGAGEEAEAKGPVDVTFADEGLGDKAFYRAEVEFDSTGRWVFLAIDSGSGPKRGAGGSLEVEGSSRVPAVGDPAPSVATPTFDDHRGVQEVCTRDPNDPMHDLSLDEALGNGKPTVLVIATPAYCTSLICGPVVEQILEVREQHAAQANFIHVEVFADRDQGEFAPGYLAFGLTTEPWTFVIDQGGVIRARYEGPVTPSEVSDALESLL